MSKYLENEDVKKLFEVILKLETLEECDDFFTDLFTTKELLAFAQRLKSADLLLKNYTYEEVIKKVNISSATLSRVSKCVQEGTGYQKMLKK
jgi:TrpR-related protein YerC/YecD